MKPGNALLSLRVPSEQVRSSELPHDPRLYGKRYCPQDMKTLKIVRKIRGYSCAWKHYTRVAGAQPLGVVL